MSELGAVLERSVEVETPVTQAYFALFHAPHPQTGESHYFLMKGKDGNKMRIFGGEADSENEDALQTILRETAEETDIVDQPTGAVKNPGLYEELHAFLEQAFSNPSKSPIYSKDHDLTEEEIAKGWHPSQNHVFEVECDFAFLEKLESISAMAITPEGQGTCLLSASEIMKIGGGCFRHPYESKAIGLHMFGDDIPVPEDRPDFTV